MFFTAKFSVNATALLLFLVFALNSQTAHARMYQWLNPETGNTQLSGKPPTWYRSTAGGPRVFVYDNGLLIDDSAVAVSELHRTSLRNRAFKLAREEDLAANERRAKLKAAMQRSVAQEEEQKQQDSAEEPSILAEIFSRALDNQSVEDIDVTAEEEKQAEAELSTVDKLKSIIDVWDAEQARQARKVLEANPL